MNGPCVSTWPGGRTNKDYFTLVNTTAGHLAPNVQRMGLVCRGLYQGLLAGVWQLSLGVVKQGKTSGTSLFGTQQSCGKYHSSDCAIESTMILLVIVE